jgi:hypothetical protein
MSNSCWIRESPGQRAATQCGVGNDIHIGSERRRCGYHLLRWPTTWGIRPCDALSCCCGDLLGGQNLLLGTVDDLRLYYARFVLTYRILREVPLLTTVGSTPTLVRLAVSVDREGLEVDKEDRGGIALDVRRSYIAMI